MRAMRVNATAARLFSVLVIVSLVSSCTWAQRSAGAGAVEADASQSATEMRAAIRFAAEATDRSLAARELRVEPLEINDAGCSSMQAIRASFPASPHDPQFIAVVKRKRVFRLGGFTSPDVAELVADVRVGTGSPELLGLSRCIARLLDPHGAVLLVPIGEPAALVGNSASLAVSSRWNAARPHYATADTVIRRSDGTSWTRVSVLSGREQLDGVEWTWRSYVLAFDRDGDLLVWHVREDEPVLLK